MKKRLLSVAVAASLSAGAINANAAALSADSPATTENYPSTIDVATSSATLQSVSLPGSGFGTDTANQAIASGDSMVATSLPVLALEIPTNAGIGAGETRYIRLDFNGATFAGNKVTESALILSDASDAAIVDASANTITVVTGGGGAIGDNYVIFSVKIDSASPAPIPIDGQIKFIPGNSGHYT
ncbi:hypothetical protein, partial [Candidatus Venteria ishoeyi]|uniref:hypothetical protein n=1 Tax=Candidatus Venteria ishoeyi TaxID=1899563 RepID=UPI0011B0DAB8